MKTLYVTQHTVFVRMLPEFLRLRVQDRPGVIRILDNIVWLFIDKILRMGIGLLMGVWIARYLGPEQFGLLSYALAFTGLFSAIAALGMQEIVVRDIVHKPDAASETLGTALALQIISGLVAYLIILVAIAYIRPHHDLARSVVAILGSVMVLEGSKIAVFWFESQVQSKYTVWVQNGGFLVVATVKIIMILNHAPLVAFAWTIVAEAFLVAVALLSVMNKRGIAFEKLKISLKRGRILLRDSWPLMIASSSSMIYMKIDQIMLGEMLGDEAVGIFSAATRISEVWNFIPMVVVASVFPAILESKKHSEYLYNNRLQRLCGLMVWLSILVALPMTFLAEPLVVLLFGGGYRKSGIVLAIHIWASTFIYLGVASGRWMLAENRQILILQRSIFGVLVNVTLNLLLIPFYGVLGSAISTVLAQFSVGLLFDLIQSETRPMFLMKMRAFNPYIIFQK
jgi:O-antigen/teichoic acid export membrane protein